MAGILLPAIVVPFVTGVRGSGKPEMVTTAMYLAEHRMEELMKYDYQTLRANSLTGLTSYASAPILKLISKRIQAYQRGAFQILCHPLPPYFN
jgi:excinuclease UvrABC ATPase subunit